MQTLAQKDLNKGQLANKFAIAVLTLASLWSLGVDASKELNLGEHLLNRPAMRVDALVRLALRREPGSSQLAVDEEDIRAVMASGAAKYRKLDLIFKGERVGDFVERHSDPLLVDTLAASELEHDYVFEERSRRKRERHRSGSDLVVEVAASSSVSEGNFPRKDQKQAVPASQISSNFAPPQAPASAIATIEAKHDKGIQLSIKDDKLAIEPKDLHITGVGDQIPLVLPHGLEQGQLSIFIRDEGVLEWLPDGQNLLSLGEGITEVYIHYNSSLYILSVTVGSGGQAEQLANPRELTARNVSQGDGHRPAATSTSSAVPRSSTSMAGGLAKPHLQPSAKTTKEAAHRFHVAPREQGFKDIWFKVFDERSDPLRKESLYPLNDVEVEILGLEAQLTTDGLGKTAKVSVPEHSQLLVRVSDPLKRFPPAIELVPAERSGLVKIGVLRQSTYDFVTATASIEPRSDEGSLCGVIGDGAGKLLDQVRVILDLGLESRSALYTNRLGLADLKSEATGKGGRFCFVGIPEGPVALSLTLDDGTVFGPIAKNVFAGHHRELILELPTLRRTFETEVLVAGSAFEQWNGGNLDERSWPSTNLAILHTLGQPGRTWKRGEVSEMVLSAQESMDGYSYYIADAAEFEFALYRTRGEQNVTPLFPKGFLEDLARLAGVINGIDYGGTVMIEHGFQSGEAELFPLTISLTDHRGQVVGDVVPWQSEIASKAVFYNVQAGTYVVNVQAADGRSVWLDTVLVYEETLSVLRTGTGLQLAETLLSSQSH